MAITSHLDVTDVVAIAALVLDQDPAMVHRRMRHDVVQGALLAPSAEIDGELVHDTLEMKAAALCAGLAQGRPLVSGSTRVAWMATVEFVRRNGFDVTTDNDPDDVIATLESLASGLISETDFARWLRQRLVPLEQRRAS